MANLGRTEGCLYKPAFVCKLYCKVAAGLLSPTFTIQESKRAPCMYNGLILLVTKVCVACSFLPLSVEQFCADVIPALS